MAALFMHPGELVSRRQVIRMGADDAPPYHVLRPDGSVQGLAVDILNEAARRSHVTLVWVPLKDVKLDDALAQGLVDAWPAVSRTPERDAVLHFSKPWLESNYCLLSRKASGISRKRMEGVRLAVASSPRVSRLAAQFFPTAVRLAQVNNLATVAAVCSGQADAGLVDARTLDSVLLDRPSGCGAIPLRIQVVPEASNPVSIAARPEAAAGVDSTEIGPIVTCYRRNICSRGGQMVGVFRYSDAIVF